MIVVLFGSIVIATYISGIALSNSRVFGYTMDARKSSPFSASNESHSSASRNELKPLLSPFIPLSAPESVSNTTPLWLGVHGLWGSPKQVLHELHVFSTISLLFIGRRIEPLSTNDLFQADIIIIGMYESKLASLDVIAKHVDHAVIIWVASENLDKIDSSRGDFHDEFVNVVDLSLGMARFILPLNSSGLTRGALAASSVASSPNFVHMPWWLPYMLEPGHCQLHSSLSAPGDADAWFARRGFATLLSSHAPYPRPELFDAFSTLANELNLDVAATGRNDRRVDAPGRAFHNMEWPGGPNSHLEGKIAFVSSYRFNIQPENSRSECGGYTTEKMPQAHVAGAVPVYWGDPVDDNVFNPKRILQLKDDGGGELDIVSLIARARLLETDAVARTSFFSEPILQAGANAHITAWCERVGSIFAKSLALKVPRIKRNLK